MTHETLFKLAMWTDWQRKVRDSLPNFAAHPIYLDQSQSEAEYEAVANYVFQRGATDLSGMLRDAEYGARVVETKHGKLTRAWLDANVEIDFLRRNLGEDPLSEASVIDIGAGYGRLAVPLSRLTARYLCVDAVPISTEVCRTYCNRHAPSVAVPSLPDFLANHNAGRNTPFDLAINIHSWNECTREQIAAWLNVLGEAKVPYLFTVSHGQNDASIEGAWYAWEPGRPTWRHLLEERYNLLAEESIGFSRHPHCLWRMK